MKIICVFLWFFARADNSSGTIKGFVIVPPGSNKIGLSRGAGERKPVSLYGKEMRIGCLINMTNSRGEYTGLDTVLGMYAARRQIEREGILGDTSLVFDIGDGRDMSGVSVINTERFLANGCFGIVGALDSYDVFPSAGYLSSQEYPLIELTGTSVELDDTSTYRSFFRIGPGDRERCVAISLVMKYFGWTLVSGLFSNDSHGMSGHIAFLNAAFVAPIRPTCTWIMNGYTRKDAESIAKCLENSEASVVLLFMSRAQIVTIIDYLEGMLKKKVLFVGCFTEEDGEEQISNKKGFLDVIDNSMSFFPSYKEDTYVDGFFDDVEVALRGAGMDGEYERLFRCSSAASADLPVCEENIQDRAEIKDGEAPKCKCTGEELEGSHLKRSARYYAADAVMAYAKAVERLRSDCETVGGEYCGQKALSGDVVVAALKKTDFEGTTGSVSFSGNQRVGGTMRVFMFDSTSTQLVTIGEVSGGKLHMQKEDKDLIVSQVTPSAITAKDGLGVVCIVFACIGIVVSVGVGWYIHANREEQTMRRASPVFCELILLGIVLGFLSTIFWTLEQNKAVCILRPWSLSLGFSLIIGNLLAKTYRIFKIFTNVKATSVVITDTQLFIFSGVIIFFISVLMFVYTFASPGVPDAVVVQSSVDTLYKYVRCYPPNRVLYTTMLAIILVSCCALTVGGITIAYLTRKVESSFNESREISFTMYTFFMLALITVPLYFTAGESRGSTEREYILRTFSVFLALSASLYFLFAQKIAATMEEKEGRAVLEAQTAGTTVGGMTTRTGPSAGSKKPKATEWFDKSHGIYET
ncbi:MAG: uncharacterized protein A8A55_0389 [Amphiamblys sp. WSBS2006]|nr:MAG: uncharacterized protein A8A55_0389 [Amphiamblys sp. WSBS2006]